MKIWIPKCGDAIRLTKDWHFNLHLEYRNANVWELHACVKMPNLREQKEQKWLSCSMPTRTELVFDRLYIRQENSEYASVTFMIKEHQDDRYVGERFWVKLDDANTIECETTSTENPVGGFAKNQYKSAILNMKDPMHAVKVAERKKAKEEVEVARAAVYEYAQQRLIFIDGYHDSLKYFNNSHLENIAKKYIELGGPTYIYMGMTQKPRQSRACGMWICDKTRKLNNGIIERDFRIIPAPRAYCDTSKMKLPGLTVVSRGIEVIEIKNLV